MAKSTAVQVKAITDDTVTVAGYGVVFGGVDLDGETFTKGTDFMLDLVPSKLVLYDHGANAGIKGNIIGRIGPDGISEDDDGLWIEAELERSAAYMDHVLSLVGAGKLGWSSGSVGHLVARDGQQIKRWPVVEFSLTPTPAEPRTLGVDVLKSLAEAAPALKELSIGGSAGDALPAADNPAVDIGEESQTAPVADVPEDARPASATAAKTADDSPDEELTEVIEHEQEGHQMSDEVKAVEPTTEKTDAGAEVLSMLKGISARLDVIERQPTNDAGPVLQPETKSAPAISKTGLGDTEVKAMAHWYRTGDISGVKHLRTGENEVTLKASNATDMNVGTAADGGYAVPTGHYQGIIARLHESSLYQRLGVMMIPGKGTTVNVPFDNEADGEFVSTAETTAFDLDAPALNQKAFTLVKYTKQVKLSSELMQDEDSRLLEFVEQWIGTGLARTHNSALVTEALASGTAGLTLDAVSAIGAAEVPELMYKLKGEYSDGAAWLLDRGTEGYIRGLTGNNFQFVPTPQGSNAGSQVNTSGRELFGAPVFNSAYMPDIGGGYKSMLFGNFGRMGLYMAPDITFLRDPYSAAGTGQVNFWYYTRFDYGVLIAEAFQYATHPTA